MPPKSTKRERSAPMRPKLENLFELWRCITEFPAHETEGALQHLMEWLRTEIDADQVVWIAAVRVQQGEEAKQDPFLGWRLRLRIPLAEDPEAYQQVLGDYYNSDHYGKLTPTYYQRSHEEKKEAHVGMTGRASLEGAGKFRVHRLRDGWIDYAAFRKTLHFQLYFRKPGIIDRLTVGYPVADGVESFFLIDRHKRPGRRLFTRREADLAGAAIRGAPEIHRRLVLSYGLLLGDKPFSPKERQILLLLLSGRSEKEIAEIMGHAKATAHKYVTALFSRFGVNSRAALMALWLGYAGPLSNNTGRALPRSC